MKWLIALAMVTVGVLHFVTPEPLVQMIPQFLPAPLFLVYLSGVIEIGLAVALLFPRTQRLAAWGLIALYVAVFPANINMAINHVGPAVPDWVAWARLPFQFVFIYLAYRLTKPEPTR